MNLSKVSLTIDAQMSEKCLKLSDKGGKEKINSIGDDLIRKFPSFLSLSPQLNCIKKCTKTFCGLSSIRRKKNKFLSLKFQSFQWKFHKMGKKRIFFSFSLQWNGSHREKHTRKKATRRILNTVLKCVQFNSPRRWRSAFKRVL